MDKQRCQHMIEVMQAYIDGKQIECKWHYETDEQWGVSSNPKFSWGMFDYRVKESDGLTKPSIDWSTVPIAYNWLARDSSGAVYVYSDRPILGETLWEYDDVAVYDYVDHSSLYVGTCDWKDSLVFRPL